MTTAAFEMDMTAADRPDDLADHVERLLAELDGMDVTDADATCAAGTGDVTVAFGFQPLPGEGVGELAARGAAILRRALDAAGVAGSGLTERSLRVDDGRGKAVV